MQEHYGLLWVYADNLVSQAAVHVAGAALCAEQERLVRPALPVASIGGRLPLIPT
jgi:hypothetical protein